VADLIKDKVLVGHALQNDLDVLMLSHPRTMIRDTAKYRPYMRVRMFLSERGERFGW
jgi:RNA exonuclease 4